MEGGDRRFEFEIGQAVDHVAKEMPAIVAGRSRTAIGRELYELVDQEGRHRFFLSHVLVAA